VAIFIFETVSNTFIIEVMDRTLKVINKMQKDGVIKNYAIGGAVAVFFYTEPVYTEDLDIIFEPIYEEKSKIDPLSPIYDYLVKERGYYISGQFIIIEGIPVQFFPVYNDLVREALMNANHKKYGRVSTRVFRPEYLIALYVVSDRVKDRHKISLLFEQHNIDANLLEDILKRYNLYKKYLKNKPLYHE
jgi:hypothetical protein